MLAQENYQKFLQLITEEANGDWLVVGGSLFGLLGVSHRVTSDIDICPLSEMTNEARLDLMNLAVKCDLSIEAINLAADFFVKQIPNWKNSIILFKKGSKGSIYRPSIELYFKLKFARATESDLQDCLRFLIWHLDQKIIFNQSEVKHLINSFIAKNPYAQKDPLIQKILSSLNPD